MGQKRRVKGPIFAESRWAQWITDNAKRISETERRAVALFVLQDVFRPYPVSGSHDYEFSMCGNHDSVHHARGHIDLAYHGRLPDVGLIQFRPRPKFGSNDFLTGSESFIVGLGQVVAGSLLGSEIGAGRERCFG